MHFDSLTIENNSDLSLIICNMINELSRDYLFFLNIILIGQFYDPRGLFRR